MVKRFGNDQGKAVIAQIRVECIQVGRIVRHSHFHQEDQLILGDQGHILDGNQSQQVALVDEQHFTTLVELPAGWLS